MIGDTVLSNFKFLGEINSPVDLKKLNTEELNQLSGEIRKILIDTVSKNGGHLSSNLGVVELSVAMHYVFNSPKDKFVWDVGHQVYTHKLLTGRYNIFSTLRTEDGISGFSAPNESEHDIFYSGHSSTSISSALGLAVANKHNGNDDYTIAVIGDGALTGGLAYEALNNAGRSGTKLIVVLNDNEMSISENVGSMARYLAVIRSKPEYYRLKENTEKILNKIPVVGSDISKGVFNIKTRVKNALYKSTFFEELGFRYMGPIDGHNIEQLCEAFNSAKLVNGPVLFHVITTKGKGYDFAEKSPSAFHGVSQFNIETGEPNLSNTNFSSEFGQKICNMATNNKQICAITAAMALGTGLENFSKKFSDRFFDVGIAEEHALTFASGLARGGMVPVVALYSSFVQRAYDQIVHDGTLQKQKIILTIDRAGFVGEDGVTHQGLLDVPLLNSVPNITIFSPFTYDRMKFDLETSAQKAENFTVIRYPRGSAPELPAEYNISENDFDLFGSGEISLVTYGRISAEVLFASEMLKEKGINVCVLVLNKIKPINLDAVKSIIACKKVFFYEEAEKSGSIGQSFAELLLENNFNGKYKHFAINDEFVPHASVKSLIKKYGFDRDSIVKYVMENVNG